MKHYLNPSQRRKSIKVWVSDEERSLIEAKAHNYCYRRLAPYIRDAAIYERVTKVNVKAKDEFLMHMLIILEKVKVLLKI